MKTRSWAAAALLAAGAPQLSAAEESLRTTQGVACAPEGGACTQFQGYVYVHRGADPEPATASESRFEPSSEPGSGFGEGRLYLHMGATDSR